MKKYVFPRLKYKQAGIINFVEYRHIGFKILYGVLLAILTLVLFLAVFPLFFLFVQAFKTNTELTSAIFKFWPEEFHLSKIIDVWIKTDMTKYFFNTIIVIIGCTICAVLFNGLLAYGVSIVKPKGSKIVYYLILGSYMIPTILSIVPLFKMIADLQLVNSYIPLWFSFGANAFYFILFKNFFDKIPTELVEAMKVDGSSDIGIFFKLILPISSSIIGVVAIFSVTASWSDFLLPKLVLTDPNFYTIMIQIFSINSTMGTVPGITPDMLLMALCISIVPQIIILFIFQKKITGGGIEGGIKG